MLDRVCARINRHLNASGSESVDSYFQVLPMSLLDDRGRFLLGDVVLDRYFDEVDIIEDVCADCLPRCVEAGYLQKFLLHDRLGESGIEILDVGTRRRKLRAAARILGPETWPALLKYLRHTRKRGFSIVVQTYSPWMNATAAVIRHPKTKEVTGTIVIAGPDIRFTEQRMLQISPALLAAAQELSLATVASPGLYGRGLRSQMSIFDEPKDDVSRKKTS